MSVTLPVEYLARTLRDEPMSRHSSWHVGGPADCYFTPRDRDDLSAFLGDLPRDVPVYWVGLGSNLLVRDGGLRGVVIATLGVFKRLERRAISACTAKRACLAPRWRAIACAGVWGRENFLQAFPEPWAVRWR
jgi:UDP-N-acetylenolpyruvoylglucosamine reductase